MKKKFLLFIFMLGLLLSCTLQKESTTPAKDIVDNTQNIKSQANIVVVSNLNIPWELVFLPTGEMLITERPGNILKISQEKKIIKIQGVEHRGEGGLLGLALHPDFKDNSFIYLYLTTRTASGLINRVERYKLIGDSLTDKKIILDNIPGASFHDGGRIAFGPDKLLYITTGDAGNTKNSQDKSSLAGKILRLTDNGDIPKDNPFGNAAYSYGHRNVQGITWDSLGNLWATEHGRSGLQSGLDELNLIIKGENYGWPDIEGDKTKKGMRTPAIHSGPDDTWAPSGAVYFKGSIFFAGLRGEALYEAKISGSKVISLKEHFKGEFGRLRTVVVGPDGYLYILTNNKDGRGSPKLDDDKIIKVDPKILN